MHVKPASVVGAAAALWLGSIPAALAAPAANARHVPCKASALSSAIGSAGSGATLNLAPGCTYYLPDALPPVTTTLTIVGHHSTLTRAPKTGSFSLLTVDADLTVINVNFTGGGGSGIDGGGAVDNAGALTVRGGIFSGNTTNEYGGAIDNQGQLTVSRATFTGNRAPYGGAIYNDNNANIYGSSFTWNEAPTLYGSPDDSDGGAIYNDDYLDIANSGFLANSTSGYGGGIYNDGLLFGDDITITANDAGFDGGGIYTGSYGTDPAALGDSTVFGNQPDNCVPAGSVTSCSF
jgi:predicted outer membrane repeat protein